MQVGALPSRKIIGLIHGEIIDVLLDTKKGFAKLWELYGNSLKVTIMVYF